MNKLGTSVTVKQILLQYSLLDYIPESVSPQERAFPQHNQFIWSSSEVFPWSGSMFLGVWSQWKQFVWTERQQVQIELVLAVFDIVPGLACVCEVRPVRSASLWVWTLALPHLHLHRSSASGFLEFVSTLSSCGTHITNNIRRTLT